MSWLQRRIGLSILLIWTAVSIVFLSIRMIPGDPAELFLARSGVIPDQITVDRLHEQLGLNEFAFTQYFESIGRMLRGDLGRSLRDGSSVASEIAVRIPRTVELIVAATLLGMLLGISGAVITVMRGDDVINRIATIFSGLILAVPVFVLGTVLVLLFALAFDWTPEDGYTAFTQDPLRHFAQLTMPAVTLGLGLAATVFRMTRASVQNVMSRSFVRTARAKGVAPSRILLHHVLRNALIPIVTELPSHVGTLVGGTILVEYLFAYQGVSGLFVEAVSARDYPIIEGAAVAISVIFITIELFIDLLRSVVDPRVHNA